MNKELTESVFPYVSIIIPTYKDWDRLNICLRSLLYQTYPKDRFEVIVINNDSNSIFPNNLVSIPNLICQTEPLPGSYNARNRALSIAKGDIIGFTDSDCIPDEKWIYNAVRLFQENEEYDRIGGNVEVFCNSTPPTIAELYDTVYAFQQENNVNLGKSVTANLFVKSFLFKRVGFFNGNLISGGDFEWSNNATAMNSKILFGKEVIVKHPARRTMKELTNKVKRTSSYAKGRTNQGRLRLLIKFLYESRPPLREFNFINQRGRHLSFLQKIRIFFVRYYLRQIRAYSELKVSIGGKVFNDKDKN